ncbi:MAG TPA: hypothetical protein VMX13_09175 [Sedimentisphaerales bacterium]|nr:hypothetical protein [Sedimentisphaerales bacterium]
MKQWAKHYNSCTKCGGTGWAHAGRGLCRQCYNKAYVGGSLGKHPHFLKVREGGNLRFTDRPRTLKKLIPVIAYRFYAVEKGSYYKKAEKAKRFIKNLLCSQCSTSYVNNWTNDYYSIDSVLSPDCVEHIVRRLDIAIEHADSEWFKQMMKCLRYKRKPIQYEMELRLRKPFYKIIKNWYVRRRMSADEIHELLVAKYLLYISKRDLRRWLNELGLMRPFVQAMRNRVVTGRMDYSKREIAYRKRKVRQQQVPRMAKQNVQPTHAGVFIEVPLNLKLQIKQIARKSKRTVSEVVRDMLRLADKDPSLAERSKCERLDYVLAHHEDKLLRQRIKRKPAELVYLAVRE